MFDFRTFLSFNFAMTIISSGGFLPVNKLSSVVNTDIKEIIFSLSMLVSFFSIFLSYNIIFFKKKKYKFFSGRYLFIILFYISFIIFFCFFKF
jgi:trk system potassium uptake protein TrkH